MNAGILCINLKKNGHCFLVAKHNVRKWMVLFEPGIIGPCMLLAAALTLLILHT